MAVVQLHNVDQAAVTKKSRESAVIGSSNITDTNWLQIGNTDGYDIGSNGGASVVLAWAVGSGTSLKARVKVSHDGTNWMWAPDPDTASSGSAAVYPAELTFSTTNWPASGGVSRLPVQFALPDWPFFQIWVQSNNGSGSISGTIRAGL